MIDGTKVELRELSARVHAEWQRRLADALRRRGWQQPRYESSGGPVPWEEVASTSVETLWSDLELLVAPVLDLLSRTDPDLEGQSAHSMSVPSESQPPNDREQLWLSADEVAPLLHTTAHSLRRLAREGRCPVVVRRIGGRWWFARVDVDRFVGLLPHDGSDRVE